MSLAYVYMNFFKSHPEAEVYKEIDLNAMFSLALFVICNHGSVIGAYESFCVCIHYETKPPKRYLH